MTQDDIRRLALQVLMPGFAGTRLPKWLSRAIHEGLGGLCLFGHNVESIDQLRAMCDDAHHLGRTLVSIDEEGGIVSRLGARHGSRHVGAAVLGVADDLALTEQVAREIAVDLRHCGIDIDLAPVVDVNSNPANPVIGVRSFGAEPERVAQHGAAFIRGLQTMGVAACAKHFPGHGDTNVDSHAGLPRIDVDVTTLHHRELVPFRAAVEAGTRMVMTAHIIFPALEDRPATVSAPVLRLLREDLGFRGVIMSDALDMQAIADTIGMAEGCVQALAAGVDLVGLGNPVLNKPDHTDERIFTDALEAIVTAAGTDRLPLARLQEAADRVAHLERWSRDRRGGELPRRSKALSPADMQAAQASLRTGGAPHGRLSGRVRVVDVRRRRNVASGRNSSLIANALVARLPGSTVVTAFAGGATAEGRAADEDAARLRKRSDHADVIITGTPALDDLESAELTRLLALSPDAVVVCTGWVSTPEQLDPARHTVCTGGDSLPTAAAVAELLTSTGYAIQHRST